MNSRQKLAIKLGFTVDAPISMKNLLAIEAGRVGSKNGNSIAPAKPEAESSIRLRISERFEVLNEMTSAVANGFARAFIVSGPAGLGKSYEIEKGLRQYVGVDKLTFIKGHVSPMGLYKLLYENCHKGQVLVFDDADSIFDNELSLNLLKGACDTTEVRNISWNSSSAEREEMPREFVYDGTIVYITNKDFDAEIEKGTKLAPHFGAMISRAHYLELAMRNRRDYLVRIKMVVESGMLKSMGFNKNEEIQIMDFVETNLDVMREASLRFVVKLAGIFKSNPNGWQRTARITLCKGI